MKPGIIVIIFICIAIGAFVAWSKTPLGKGALGELIVKFVIGKTKEGKKYVINNYMLVDEGKSSQIDHIVIRPNGLFVIETKNYSGRIYGNENQHEWTQVLAYGKVKNKLYNPLKQNATHIYKINKIINARVNIRSLVVFVQSNTKYINAQNVIPLFDLKKNLKRLNEYTLTEEEMKNIYQQLINAKANNTVSKKEHVQGIQDMKQNIEKGICPRCGGTLVEKQGKYGTFYGCENYPKCKFIKKH